MDGMGWCLLTCDISDRRRGERCLASADDVELSSLGKSDDGDPLGEHSRL